MTIKEKDYFTALYEVARVINASLEPSEVLEKIAHCVTEAMGVKACSIRSARRARKASSHGGIPGAFEGVPPQRPCPW